MARNLKALAVAAALVGGIALTGGSPPAGADYVPFTIVDPVKGPAGTVITATGDTWCATTTQEPGQNIQPGVPGTVLVEFGVLKTPLQLGGEANLDQVLASTTVAAGADGMWSAQLTVPEGTPPGKDYGVVGHCTVEYEGETTTTAPTSTSTTVAPPDPSGDAAAAPEAAAAPRELAVLQFDFFPAAFEVTEGADAPATTTTVPGTAAPANAVPGQADFTG